MFDYREYYKLLNTRVAARYQKETEELRWIAEEMKSHKGPKESRLRFLRDQARFLLTCTEMESRWSREYFLSTPGEQLKKDQDLLYGELARNRYGKSTLNPAFAAKVLGQETGPLLSAVAAQLRQNIRYAYRHMQFAMHWNHELLLELFQLLNQDREVQPDEIRTLLEEHAVRNLREKQGLRIHEVFGFEDRSLRELIEELDWTDPFNLYSLGVPVAEDDIKLSRYMAGLPEETVEKMAVSYVQGFRKGFFRNGKDILGKKTVALIYPLGMERMIARAIALFREEIHYIPYIRAVDSTMKNKQYAFDHRFDFAAYSTELYFEEALKALEAVVEDNRDMIAAYGGPAVVESFGETPFTPQMKKEALSLTEEQTRLYTDFSRKRDELMVRYASPEYTSFTIIAFPTPAIGDAFESIFDRIIQINTLDEARYEQAQQAMIDVLDQAERVYVKGAGDNETDISVALHTLDNPARQTNFFNCLADVNIPVGEVFTSPVLQGTGGVLHVKEAYLNGLRYENLKMTFRDGYVETYSCTGFESEEAGKQFIEQNLLFPHRTLPLGEFAIGTNTTAYRLAQEYGIAGFLPVLIAEKMGPHFAVGDTCFAREEDRIVLNPANGKEIVARDNEKTALRKEQPEQAYTDVHTDIVLPFDQIEQIAAVGKNGTKTDIIREGRFVLRGTELLNEPLQ